MSTPMAARAGCGSGVDHYLCAAAIALKGAQAVCIGGNVLRSRGDVRAFELRDAFSKTEGFFNPAGGPFVAAVEAHELI
jgi:hypothetical protein